MSTLVGKALLQDLISPPPDSKPSDREDVSLGTGVVIAASGAEITVRVGDAELCAARAASCLLEPFAGDLVLLAMPEGGCYVLAILRREEGAPSRIAAEGDLELSAPKGKVVVAAGEGIDLLTPKEASVIADRLSLRAADVTAVLDRLSYLGSAVRAELGKLRVAASKIDGFFERTLQRVKRSYRFVEEIDQVRAKQIDMTAEGSVRVHAESVVVTADGLCKIDGEQIHLG
jgi:ethanolamine utilization microcompartment shell protein EutS